MSIDVDLAKWRDLTMKQVNAAAVRAMNRAAVSTRLQVVKEVQAAIPTIKSGDIKRQTETSRAKQSKGGNVTEATLTVKHKPVGLEAYAARAKKVRTQEGPRQGVTVKVKSSRVLVKGGFFFRMAGGGMGIAKREGAERGPIRRLFGPGIAQIVGSQWTLPKLLAFARETFVRNFKSELNFQRSKAGKA